MTAYEVIDQIKALAPEERAKVLGFIREMETATGSQVKTADTRVFTEAADWVFREHSELMSKLSK